MTSYYFINDVITYTIYLNFKSYIIYILTLLFAYNFALLTENLEFIFVIFTTFIFIYSYLLYFNYDTKFILIIKYIYILYNIIVYICLVYYIHINFTCTIEYLFITTFIYFNFIQRILYFIICMTYIYKTNICYIFAIYNFTIFIIYLFIFIYPKYVNIYTYISVYIIYIIIENMYFFIKFISLCDCINKYLYNTKYSCEICRQLLDGCIIKESEEICIICYTNNASIQYLNCNHNIICLECVCINIFYKYNISVYEDGMTLNVLRFFFNLTKDDKKS